MVTRKAAGKNAGKLKLKKETIKNLTPKRKVKGGAVMVTAAACARGGGGYGGILPATWIAPPPASSNCVG